MIVKLFFKYGQNKCLCVNLCIHLREFVDNEMKIIVK